MNLRVKRGLSIGLVVLLASIFALFLGRNVLINQLVKQKTAQIAQRYGLTIGYDGISMNGISALTINGLRVVPYNCDTLLYARSLKVGLNAGKLLLLKVVVNNIEAESLTFQFLKDSTESNFDFLYKKGEDTLASSPEKAAPDYNRKVNKTLRMFFRTLPADALLRNLVVRYKNNDYHLSLTIPEFNVNNDRFTTEVISVENDEPSRWVAEGVFQDNDSKVAARLYARDKGKVALPFLNYRFGLDLRFDTLAFEFQELPVEKECTSVVGSASVSGLTMYHHRISPDPVVLDKGSFLYKVNFGENYIELDSAATKLTFNTLSFQPYVRLEKSDAWKLIAAVNKTDFPSDDLFSSLPKGLFYNLEGLRTDGTLSYHFLFNLDMAQVDSLIFESSLIAKNFHILSYGNTDLRKMNSSFMYTAYEDGSPVRSFEIGDSNPGFRPIHAIAPNLQLAIMQNEDGGFYYHNGFLPGSIREALIQDIKERRFARGGSTISMQLVKNVFLSRTKTVARKLEEALIVWLIESNRLTSKERMYEVYLNIVEWGPLVYGANEASRFYFNKDASALTWNEAIFLAMLVPRPKSWASCFTDELQLKPTYEGFYQLIAARLLDRGVITAEEAAGIKADITISGPARRILLEKHQREDDATEELPELEIL